jgi:hypothetical protein
LLLLWLLLQFVARETENFIELGLLTLAFDSNDQPDAVLVGQPSGDDILTTFEESLEEGVVQIGALKAAQKILKQHDIKNVLSG